MTVPAIALEAHGINKSFGSLVVANNIEFSLPAGERYALIGPNGAGKTTFINLMTGMLQPDSGSILLSGQDIATAAPATRVKRGLVRQVDEALSLSGLDPSCVELEITEQSLVDNIEASIAQLNLLKERGVKLAIDDFGTGFTSLSYVKRLPIDKLKIDMTFVKDLPNSPDDAAIAMTIVSLAQGLNLKVDLVGRQLVYAGPILAVAAA